MATESPLRDVMLDIIASERVGLDAVQLVGELIAADAAFNMQMADLQGRSDSQTWIAGFRFYQEQIESAQAAWRSFTTATTGQGAAPEDVHEALIASLRVILASLQASPVHSARPRP